MTFRKVSTLIAASILFGMTGCKARHPYYLVESSYLYAGRPDASAEITSTTEYDARIGKRLSIALDAPDRCADRGSVRTRGSAAPAGEVLHATCGAEMSELERALARGGHRVVSWDAVRELVRQKPSTTTLEAARTLGADVLLHVNSLEHTIALPGHDDSWERRFYESSRRGEKGPAIAVPEVRARTLEEGIRKREAEILSRGQESVTLDVTAISVATGQAIWFYHWQHTEEFEDAIIARELYLCNKAILERCFEVSPPARKEGEEGAEEKEAVRSGGAGSTSFEARDFNAATSLYFRLVRESVEDLVRRFTNGDVS